MNREPIRAYDPIIFYDGYCNLCNAAVQMVIHRDKNEIFHFAPLNGPTAKELFGNRKDIIIGIPDSFLLYQKGNLYTESTAALRVLSQLPWWKWTKIFLVIPRWLRNPVYRFVARNRYRWFGKRDQCTLPSPELRRRFLD